MSTKKNFQSTPPLLVIFMGVSGCGKSTIALNFSQLYNLLFLDADDFHSLEAKEKMQQGIPLDDIDRKPWIETISNQLKSQLTKNVHCCLAYSGLRKAHRDQIRKLGFRIVFFHLVVNRKQLASRLSNRKDHFFDQSLLDSQFKALENTEDEADIVSIDSSESILQVTNTIQESILSLTDFFGTLSGARF